MGVAATSGDGVAASRVGVAEGDGSVEPPPPHAFRAAQAKTPIVAVSARRTPARIAPEARPVGAWPGRGWAEGALWSAAFARRVDLDLPDRRLGLDTVDQRAGGVERLAAVRRGGGHDHARLRQRHGAEAVLQGDRAAAVGGCHFLADRAQLGLRHLDVGLVVELGHLAGDALEQHDGAGRWIADGVGQTRRGRAGSAVTRTRRTTSAPPLTGGTSATSSASLTSAEASAYSRLIATTQERGATSIAASRSATRAPSGSSICTRSDPARSRRPANRRTVTTTRTP